MDKIVKSNHIINMKSNKDFFLLSCHMQGFLNCKISNINENDIEFINLEKNYKNDELSFIQKKVVILNIIELIKNKPSYIKLIIEPNNIFVNDTMQIKMLSRALSENEKNYLRCLKVLTLYYFYNIDFYKEINKKFLNKKLVKIRDLDSLIIFVNKIKEPQNKGSKIKRIIYCNVIILFAIINIVTVFNGNNYKEKYEGFKYYEQKNYKKVIETLKDIKLKDNEEKKKYVIASIEYNMEEEFIKKQYLNKKYSNDYYLVFKYLDNKLYEKAIEIAKKIKDVELENYISYEYKYYKEERNE